MKLSIIVPVYNVAPYLRKCVESLLAQDYDNYEIILVDDGSPDSSGAICDEYVSSNELVNERVRELERPLIRVIHQKNAGLSAARNAGLKVAKGDYICFVDSDDYWEPNVLKGLMTQVEQQDLDVLRFDFQNVNERNEIYLPDKHPHQIDTQVDYVSGEQYLNTRIGYGCYACQFVIRREIVPKFKEGIYFEDTEWTPRMLIAAKRVNATTTVVYNYLTRRGSITKRFDKEHIRKKIDSLMRVNAALQSLLTMVEDRRWLNGCIADNVHNILNNAATYDYESVPSLVNIIRNNNMLPLKGFKVRKVSLMRYQLINLSPRLYCWLRHARMVCLKK